MSADRFLKSEPRGVQMSLTSKQKGVLRGIVTGAAVTVIAITSAVVWHPPRLLPEDGLGNRLVFALQWDVLLLLSLVLSIGWLARHRFFSPEDIDGGGLSSGTAQATMLQSVLQNTLEQVVLGVLTHMLWAVTMPLTWQAAIPVAAMLFLFSRLLFARGYEGGAPARALGFALTFYPSVLMLLGIVVQLVLGSQ